MQEEGGKGAEKERGGADTVGVNKVWWNQGMVRQGGKRGRWRRCRRGIGWKNLGERWPQWKEWDDKGTKGTARKRTECRGEGCLRGSEE